MAFRRDAGSIEDPLLNGAATNRRQPSQTEIKLTRASRFFRHSGMVREDQTRNLEIPGSLRAPE
jgi:hypothetical protein